MTIRDWYEGAKCHPVTLEHISIGLRDGSSRKDKFLYALITSHKSYLTTISDKYVMRDHTNHKSEELIN